MVVRTNDIEVVKFNLSRRSFIDLMIRGSVVAGFGYPIVIEPNMPKVEHVSIPIPNLPPTLQGLKIGFLADIHKGLFVSKSDIRVAIRLLMKQKPDIICLGGDFVQGKAENIHPCAKTLSTLEAPLGIYAVLGNHDCWTDANTIVASLAENGITTLRNDAVKLLFNDERFYLVGIDDVWNGQPNIYHGLQGVPKEAMKILLVHEPDYADHIRRIDSFIPLQISGHSHGGQVVIPFKGAPYLPYLAREYPMGLQKVKDANRWVYTTRGIGVTLPLRFNCRPEISILTLMTA